MSKDGVWIYTSFDFAKLVHSVRYTYEVSPGDVRSNVDISAGYAFVFLVLRACSASAPANQRVRGHIARGTVFASRVAP